MIRELRHLLTRDTLMIGCSRWLGGGVCGLRHAGFPPPESGRIDKGTFRTGDGKQACYFQCSVGGHDVKLNVGKERDCEGIPVQIEFRCTSCTSNEWKNVKYTEWMRNKTGEPWCACEHVRTLTRHLQTHYHCDITLPRAPLPIFGAPDNHVIVGTEGKRETRPDRERGQGHLRRWLNTQKDTDGLNRWVKRESGDDREVTHLDLFGGSYNIPDEMSGAFLRAYARDLREASGKHPKWKWAPYISEQRTEVFAMFCELDFKLPGQVVVWSGGERSPSGATSVEGRPIVKVIQQAMAKALPGSDVTVVVLNADAKTVEQKVPRSAAVFKSGLHLHWSNIAVTSTTAQQLRQCMIHELSQMPDANIAAYDWEDIIDMAVFTGNGIRMLRSWKKIGCKCPKVEYKRFDGTTSKRPRPEGCVDCDYLGFRTKLGRPYDFVDVVDNSGATDRAEFLRLNNDVHAQVVATSIRRSKNPEEPVIPPIMSPGVAQRAAESAAKHPVRRSKGRTAGRTTIRAASSETLGTVTGWLRANVDSGLCEAVCPFGDGDGFKVQASSSFTCLHCNKSHETASCLLLYPRGIWQSCSHGHGKTLKVSVRLDDDIRMLLFPEEQHGEGEHRDEHKNRGPEIQIESEVRKSPPLTAFMHWISRCGCTPIRLANPRSTRPYSSLTLAPARAPRVRVSPSTRVILHRVRAALDVAKSTAPRAGG